MTGCSYDSPEAPCDKPATVAVRTRSRGAGEYRDVWVEVHADHATAPKGVDAFCNGHGLAVAMGVLAALGVADR